MQNNYKYCFFIKLAKVCGMVIPARRFRNNDIIVPDINKTASDKQDFVEDRNKSFVTSGLNSHDILSSICDNNHRGMIYLISGIKLDGYFCDFDNEVIVLESLNRDSKQMVYQHAIATLKIED